MMRNDCFESISNIIIVESGGCTEERDRLNKNRTFVKKPIALVVLISVLVLIIVNALVLYLMTPIHKAETIIGSANSSDDTDMNSKFADRKISEYISEDDYRKLRYIPDDFSYENLSFMMKSGMCHITGFDSFTRFRLKKHARMTAVFHNDTELEVDVTIYLTAELVDGHWRFSDVVIVSGENTGDGCLSENT